MIYDFDYFKRFEAPQLVLCQPDDKEIGVIQGASDLKLVINLNEVSTLSYKIYNNDEDYLDENGYPDETKPNIYRLHRERRQVHAIGVGYFIITDINEIEDEKGVYKNVSCKSCEYELNNIACPGVALKEVNMYQLYNNESYDMLSNYERFRYLEDITTEEVGEDDTGVYVSKSCILFNLLCYAPSWRLSDACVQRFNDDQSEYYKLGLEQRNLTDEDTTIYAYLKNNVSKAWDCFVSFNIEDRTIDIYKYEDMLVPSDMVLSEANVLEKCEVKTDIDDYVNSLKVSGGTADVYISDFTKTGENVIYNFDHDIAIGMIEGEMKEALEYWDNLVDETREIVIEEGALVPKEVYPDRLTGYKGDNLYQFLDDTTRSLDDWSKAYEDAKAQGSSVINALDPPQIFAIFSGKEGYDQTEAGVYELTVKRALRVPVEDQETHEIILGDVAYITCNGVEAVYQNNEAGRDPSATPEAQAADIKAIIDASFSAFFTTSINGATITLTQVNPGVGVPGFRIENPRENIRGMLGITVVQYGHAALETKYIALTPDHEITDEMHEYAVESSNWTQNFYVDDGTGTILASDAKKALQFLNEELMLAEDRVMFTKSYREAYQVQIDKLEQEAISNGIDIDRPSTYQPTWANEYNDAKKYYGIIDSFYTAYTELRDNLMAWVSTVEIIVDEANYGHTFQGAFYDYYYDKYSDIVNPAEREEVAKNKATKLYNRLTKLFKQQKYQDDSVVITSAMSMEEKYEQEELLYNKGVKMLSKLIQPNAEISIDAEPFMFSLDYETISRNIKMGHCIYVRLPNGEVPLYHLNQITVDYDVPSCQLTFGDRIRSSDPADIFGDLQSVSNTAANIVASERIEWGVQRSAVNYLMKEKDADIASTFRKMADSVNNVVIDSHGLSCYSVNPETNEEDCGFWGANGAMMFYRYDSVSKERIPEVAIGKIYKANGDYDYGFWGNKILANTITSEKLAVGAISNGANYLRNGSFEGMYGPYGNTATVSSWYKSITDNPPTNVPAKGCLKGVYDPNDQTSLYDDSSVTYIPVGKKCLRLQTQSAAGSDGNPNDGWSAKAIQTTDKLSGGSYTMSFYYKFKTSGSQVRCKVKVNNSSSSDYELTRTGGSTYDRWQRGVIEIEVGDAKTVTVTFECLSGTVYLDGAMLAKGTNIQTEYSPHVSETYAMYTAIDDNGVKIYNGDLVLYDADGARKIYTSGNDLYVRGHIEADTLTANTSGSIANWIIDNNELYYRKNNKHYMGLGSAEERVVGNQTIKYPAIWAGYTLDTAIPDPTIENDTSSSWFGYPKGFNATNISDSNPHGANFMLLHDGRLYCQNARIRGHINATSLSLGNYSFSTSGTTLSYGGNTIVSSANLVSQLTNSDMFDEDTGKMKPDYLDIDMGGWRGVTSTWGTGNAGLASPALNNYNVFLTSTPQDEDSWVIWTGTRGNTPPDNPDDMTTPGTTAYNYETAFGVTADGRIYCHGAQVNGDIVCNTLKAGSIINYSSGNSYATLGGSWKIGNHTLYTTSGGSDSSTYTLDNKGTFMLDASGNAYSLGSFYTGKYNSDASGFSNGIRISENNVYFGKRNSQTGFGVCSGAVSCAYDLSERLSCLAISGTTAILFGEKVGGLDGNIDGWRQVFEMSVTKNSESFYPLNTSNQVISYKASDSGTFYLVNGTYTPIADARIYEAAYIILHGGARPQKYEKVTTTITTGPTLGTSTARWDKLYVKDINMTGSITGLTLGATSFGGSITPSSSTYNVGGSSSRWNKLYVKDIDMSGGITGFSVSSDFVPDSSVNLGSPTVPWNWLYVNVISASNANSGTGKFGISVSGHLTPLVHNTHDLGRPSRAWRNTYTKQLGVESIYIYNQGELDNDHNAGGILATYAGKLYWVENGNQHEIKYA